jgi:peptidoglycan hydrolase-like protein with peptidoglycan-binding domain
LRNTGDDHDEKIDPWHGFGIGIGDRRRALDFAADADDVPNAVGNMPAAPGTSHHWLTAANLSKDDIRWAQVELHNVGLYNGSLDGVVGPETKRALLGFQKSNGLERTAMLDQQTADALIGNTSVGQGSSMPPKGAGAGSMTNSSGTSDFGSHTGLK